MLFLDKTEFTKSCPKQTNSSFHFGKYAYSLLTTVFRRNFTPASCVLCSLIPRMIQWMQFYTTFHTSVISYLIFQHGQTPLIDAVNISELTEHK